MLGDEMLDESFKVSMKKTFTKSNDDSGKMKVVDTGFEGFFDMITKGEAIIKAMEKFEQQAFPQLQQDSKKKVVKLEGVEEYLKENG